jgi:hypothetical protein
VVELLNLTIGLEAKDEEVQQKEVSNVKNVVSVEDTDTKYRF